MEILKKNYVRVLAVIMAVIISVSTPISDFADTQGIHETEAAAATTLITVAKLFGAIAGAYGIYIASDKLADLSEEWVTWTSTHNSQAYNDLQSIKQGVVGYVITRFLAKSVADYLKTKTAPSAYYTVKGEPYSGIRRLPASVYTESFYDNVLLSSRYADDLPVFIRWDSDSRYSSGIYTFYYVNTSSDFVTQHCFENEEAASYLVHIPTIDNIGQFSVHEQLCLSIFDEKGMCIAFQRIDSIDDYTIPHVKYYYDGSLGWCELSKSESRHDPIDVSTFETGYYDIPYDLYITSLSRNDTGASIYDIKENTIRVKSINVDYSVHGNNALDNTDSLVGAEVTEDKLVNLHDVSSEAYQSWLKSQQNNEDTNEEDDPNLNLAMNAALASAIASAVAKELKDMGYIENPSDTPSEGVDDAILGDIQISVDGVTEAVRQLGSKLQNIAEGIANFPTQIRDAIRSVFEELFVPDEEAITDAVLELSNEFSFFNSLTSVVDDIGDSLSNASGPPEIYIHFEDAEDSKYTPVGTIKLLSFEWYEPYKPYGDALLSSMMILFFLWRIRKRLSDMIQGVSSSDVAETKGGE